MAKPKKLTNGKYQLRIRLQHPISNKWVERSTTKRTIKECTDWEAEMRSKIMNGVSPEKVKLFDFYELWFDTYKKNSVGFERQLKIKGTKKAAIAFFGENIYLSDLDRIKYQQWINHLGIEKNLAVATVTDTHKIFKSMIAEAIELGYITTNPCRKIVMVGRDTSKERKTTLSMTEWQKLRDVILGSKYECASKYVSLTMIYTGLRFQEATGLRISDVDLRQKKLYISEAYDYKRTKEMTETKTAASIREVDIVDDLIDILSPIISNYRVSKKVVSINCEAEPTFLFVNEEDGNPITNKALNAYLEKKCKQAGIQKITSHAFRHSKTDLLVLAGADMIYTQKQLGHANAATTLKYYSSLSVDIRDKNKNTQNEFLKKRWH